MVEIKGKEKRNIRGILKTRPIDLGWASGD